ncbi:GAF and ANTAR domain-containing protein [Aeromicrobium sp. Marseille-Q0843]|uniref:GAF and ANTAR domain-containing protein n=1 Tax=Aeromicrobium phoceense TaxID=2754045 RepID=A0A838XPX9_9ACTN|nr:GAF and ANTAR domain-containing protein [Aeromicrobium phoceense]MBA4609074.1 GAF and ANTAR domain-containing protein [Aeromicrobium phoceense]
MTETYDHVISRLAAILAALQDVEPMIERLCEAGRRMLNADGAAIVLPAESDLRVTACATDELAATLEDVQSVVGQGPTPSALDSGDVISAEVSRSGDGVWPLFHERVRQLGFVGVLTAVPLIFEHHTVGVLSVHRKAHDKTDAAVYRFLGAALGAALLEDPANALGGTSQEDAWSSQAKVHQATGMVIAQVGVRPTDAIALLRAQAFSAGTTLLEVAEHVLERQINFRNFTVEGD